MSKARDNKKAAARTRMAVKTTHGSKFMDARMFPVECRAAGVARYMLRVTA